MKPTKKTKKLWSSFKNEQKLFENWRQYTKGDALNEGILDWFGGGKEEEPTTGETDEEFEAANTQSQADQEQREAGEIERVKEDILKTADSFGDYLPDVYDFVTQRGQCEEDTEDCKSFGDDYPTALWEFLILNSGPLGRGDVRKMVVKFYEQAINSNRMSLQALKDLQAHLNKNLEKVLAQRDSTSMAGAAGRERVRKSQSQPGEWQERGNTGTYYQRGKGYHPGGTVAVRENKQRKTIKARLLKRRK